MRHLSVEHGARDSCPAVAETFGQLRECVFTARKQDVPTLKIVGKALENAFGRSFADDLRLDAVAPKRIRGHRANRSDLAAGNRAAQPPGELGLRGASFDRNL